MMSIVYGPKWPFYSCCDYFGLLGTGFMQVMYLGRALRTNETLLDFLKWRRVTQHLLVFCGLTGSQRTPRFGASQCCQSIGQGPSIYRRNICFFAHFPFKQAINHLEFDRYISSNNILRFFFHLF